MHSCGQAKVVPSISGFYVAYFKAASTIIAAAYRFLVRSISNILTLNSDKIYKQALRVLYHLMLISKMKTKCGFI